MTEKRAPKEGDARNEDQKEKGGEPKTIRCRSEFKGVLSFVLGAGDARREISMAPGGVADLPADSKYIQRLIGEGRLSRVE
uniref:Uncharacterized protein n=1 Tax=Candidatus Kentrum sp. TC TaxID=2126339 RepID=A0A450YWF3_9GAMM|nr:MAG: hypothetical protein BECKTC1821E_GA0114239_105418 [Candidatus Kentron sp. TC]